MDKEMKECFVYYLVDIRDHLIDNGLEPVIDEVLKDLDPNNEHKWNLMVDDSDYKAEPLEDWLVDRALDNPNMFV